MQCLKKWVDFSFWFIHTKTSYCFQDCLLNKLHRKKQCFIISIILLLILRKIFVVKNTFQASSELKRNVSDLKQRFDHWEEKIREKIKKEEEEESGESDSSDGVSSIEE